MLGQNQPTSADALALELPVGCTAKRFGDLAIQLVELESCTAVLVLMLRPVAAVPHLAVDLDSGQVLSRQQAFDPWHPASLTKLMTAYTVFRAIQNGEVDGNHKVVVSDNARKQPPSKMGYRTGTSMTIDNALKLLLVKSANDIGS